MENLGEKNQKLIFWISVLLGLIWAGYRLFASQGYILDDEATHYLRSRSVWVNPDLFFDLWTRAGRNLVHSLVAPFGLNAARLFTLALATIAVFLTAKCAKHLGLKTIWAVPILMMFQAWFPDLSYSILTQTPFLIIWILGIYLSQKGRYYGASFCFGYLSLIRHEGILLTAFWGLWVSCQQGGVLHSLVTRDGEIGIKSMVTRDVKLAFFTILPILLFNVADYLYEGKIPFMVYFESNPTDYYGSGAIYHYAMLLVPALGLVSLILSLFGACFIRKDLSKWSLILFTYVGYFVMHSFVYWQGLFASGGYYHFLMPMAPLFALLGVKAFDVVSEKFKRISNYIIPTVLMLVLYQGVQMIQQQGNNQDWEGIMNGTATYHVSVINPPITAEERGANMRAACVFMDELHQDEIVTGNHPHIDIYFGNLQTKETMKRDWSDITHLPAGTYFIWDQRLSELREQHNLDKFNPEEWKQIKAWENSKLSEVKKNPDKAHTTIIFQKIK